MAQASLSQKPVIIITRPEPAAGQMSARLVLDGYDTVIAPMGAYEDLPAQTGSIAADALLFTSAQGVESFCARDSRRGLIVFAVGETTAAAAQKNGFTEIATGQSGSSVGLGAMIEKHATQKNVAHVLHPCGEDVAEEIAVSGVEVTRVPLYRFRLAEKMPQALTERFRRPRQDGAPLFMPFFSARAAAHFAELARKGGFLDSCSQFHVVCISKRVADAVSGLPWKSLDIAQRPELDAVLSVIAQHKDHPPMTGQDDDQNPETFSDRRHKTDRRQDRAQVDRKGNVHGDSYSGPDRRSGVDRRAFLQRQQERVRAERMKFFWRTVLTTIFLTCGILYAAILLLAPEMLSQKKKTAPGTVHYQPQTRLNAQKPAADAPVSAKINHAIETAANKTAAVAATTQQAVNATMQEGLPALAGMLGRVRTLAQTQEGRAAMAQAMATLKTSLAQTQGQPEQIGAAVADAKKKDPSVEKILGDVNDKDLQAAAMLLALTEFRGNVDTGGAFASDIAAMRAVSGNDPELQAALDRLTPYAESGVLSRTRLQSEFHALAGDIVMAKLQGEDLSVKERMLKRLNGLVKVRRIDDIEGESVDAVVARAQLMLDKGDVKGAMTELHKLDGAPAQKAAPWMDMAGGRVAADEASLAVTQQVLGQISSAGGFPLQSLISTISGQLRGAVQPGGGASVPYLSPSLQQK